jgi:drug/metabolite transporter (DMT)-like permease
MDRRSSPGGFDIPITRSWGVALALGAAVISGVAIWLNGFAVKLVPDPMVYTTLKNAVAVMVLLVLALPAVRASDVRVVDRRRGIALALVGVLGGGLAFLLFFTGLASASAPSAAFIQKTLFIWVAVLAVPFLGERLGALQLVALGILVVGQAIVLPPQGIVWGSGETLILAATALWAIEVVLVRRFLRDVATPIVAVGRLGIGLIALVIALALSGGSTSAITPQAWGWIAVTGFVLAAYVGTWFAALRRAPATVVTSLLVGGAVITGALQAIARGSAPSAQLSGGYLLIALAIGVIALASRRRTTARLATSAASGV